MIVYKATNLENGKIYVGLTIKKTLDARMLEHYKSALKYGSTTLFSKAIRKHNVFSWNILCKCRSKETLAKKEKYWIKKFDSCNSMKGYNLTNGGEGTTGLKWTEEAKKKFKKVCVERSKKYPPHLNFKYDKYHIDLIRIKSRKQMSKIWKLQNIKTGAIVIVKYLKTWCKKRKYNYNSLRTGFRFLGKFRNYRLLEKEGEKWVPRLRN